MWCRRARSAPAIEWYDFLIYGTAAALVLNKLFFPSFDPFVGTLAAFSTDAVGFVARPIGGAIIGHFGDRLGRKEMLVVTMITMGFGTFLIGCLPTYEQIGVWAPILLDRAALRPGHRAWRRMERRRRHGDRAGRQPPRLLRQPGADRLSVGAAASTGIFAPDDQAAGGGLPELGWRVPFLISILLVGVGFIVRLKLVETPHFKEVVERKEVLARPVLEVLRTRLA